MTQTCQILDSLRPLWANQGLQYHRRIRLWDSIIGQSAPCKTTATSMQESEAQTLEQLYSPWYDAGFASDSGRSGEWAMGDENVRELLKTLQSATGHTGSALLHEEQEREIACEVEKESQVSRPPIYKPCQHQVHEDICHFVRSGKFPGNSPSKSVTLAFWGLKHSSVGKTEYPDALGPRLYATLDFDRTVLISPGDLTDDFCKPVNWVLSGVHSDDLIIVSQYEANHILPMVRQSENSRLSIYAPRITKPMRSFKDLDFFGVGAITPTPAELMTQYLELFSGSLYFESFEDYKNFRYLLGLLTDDLGDIPESDMTNDGFVKPSARLRLSWPLISPFAVSPLPFLSALVQMRTKGSAFQQSHMGSIIQATPLTAGRF